MEIESLYTFPNCPSFCKDCILEENEGIKNIKCTECLKPNTVVKDSYCACIEGYAEDTKGVCKGKYHFIEFF